MIGKALPDNIFKAQADGNLLAIVCIFMILGYYFSKHDDKKDGSEGQMFQMVSIFYETISSIVNFFMYFTSFAVFAIIAKNVALIKDLDGLVSIYPLAYTFIGSIVACFFVYCVLCGVVIQKNPFQILKEYKDPIVTAISTSSSATALSQMIIVGKNRHPNYEKETNFIMTMLSTFQMSGSAVYFTVVTIFVAVMNGKPLDFGHYIILAIVVIMVTIANSPVPLSVIVFLNVVCNSIGVTVSTRLQSVLITFDCFLDRLITTLNVIGGIFTFEIVFALYTKQNPQVKKYVSTTIDNDPGYVFY
ncbi:hypothetical protein MHBO_003547 [Bonamia ostreae]|uniref:Amino acid transporter n=1 Tax=Bonamia ostreae TaxID=126728 RepID=A0ABV2AQS8_9EUKA